MEPLVGMPLLDRLTDLEPNLSSDQPFTRKESVRRLKAAVRRDLEWLFNTRANHDITTEYPEVFKSVYNYGLPDFTHISLANVRDRHKLQRQLEMAIGYFEPRLSGVKVKLIEGSIEVGRVVRFQIDGLLKMDPAPEHVSFDTVLDVPSGEYQVKGDGSAG